LPKTTSSITITVGDRQTTGVVYPADPARRLGATLVLAHGAGAGHTSKFVVQFAEGLSARGVDAVTFNFLYTEQKRKLPDRPDVLEACYRAVIAAARTYPALAGNKVFIGGKSMGGRIASQLAAAGDATAAALSGLVLFGYPLHPPGRPEQLRIAHLPDIRVPVLVVQGERDPFGSPDELRPHLAKIGAPVVLNAIERGDHSLAPPKGGARSADQVHAEVQEAAAAWIADRLRE
jgi:predicted alpha/beta-hydrolase family hydrolase